MWRADVASQWRRATWLVPLCTVFTYDRSRGEGGGRGDEKTAPARTGDSRLSQMAAHARGTARRLWRCGLAVSPREAGKPSGYTARQDPIKKERKKEERRQLHTLCAKQQNTPVHPQRGPGSPKVYSGATPPLECTLWSHSAQSYSHTLGSSVFRTPLPARTARRAAAMCGSSSSTGMMVGWPTPPGAVPSSSIVAMAAS